MVAHGSIWWFLCIVFLLYTVRVNCTCTNYGQNLTTTIMSWGKIRGTITHVKTLKYDQDTAVRQYLGVPYAKPPTGDLRFRRPVKAEAWNDTIRDFFCFPKACIQSTSYPWPWPWRLKNTEMDEDCLYMNIWAPFLGSPITHKPVLFFIHGGGIVNASGSASDPIYNGRALSGLGDIIVVVPNYRIGTLGFWSTRLTSEYPVHSKEGRAPGNVGIWDLLMALEWVCEHIESFGGDKDRITIAGQGFGAVIANLLSMTYEAKGLFKRLILQSGSAMWPHNRHLTYNFKTSQTIAKKMGCANESHDLLYDDDKVIDCMLAKDAVELAEAEVQTNGFYPVWGDDLLERNPRQVSFENVSTFSELFIGFSGNEGLPLILDSFPETEVFRSKTKQNTSTSSLHEGNSQQQDDWRRNLSIAEGDYSVICPAIYYAQISAQYGVKVYFYHFDYRSSKSVYADWITSAHFDEVEFIFGLPHINKTIYSKEDQDMSHLLMWLWSNFVKSGELAPEWPPFDVCNFYSSIRTLMDSVSLVQMSRKDLARICNEYRNKYIY